ncbi:MAG: penicillin-binding transpeptidase domain-containing protein [Bacillota bacterium]
MLEKIKDRNNQMIIFFSLFIFILFIRLFSLTIVKGEEYKQMADNIRIKKIPIEAPRGEIRDRYGRLLAGNKPSFTVQIMKNELIDEQINQVAITLLHILSNNGEKYVDNLPIITEGGNYVFTYDKEIEEWLIQNNIDLNATAEEAFNALRKEYDIDPNLDAFGAQAALQQEKGIYPPISVKTMKYLAEMQKNNFLQKYTIDEGLSAGEAFSILREKLKIPQELSDEDARKIMVIRHELKEQGYRQYQPVKIAFNVTNKTIAAIEEMSMELPGVYVEMEPIRYYPNGNLASHVLGYLSKISDTEKEKFVNELGYAPNELIGKDGLERVFESELKGQNGAKYVEVDVYGRLINVLREEQPKKGNTVYLTIDARLQEVAEKALQNALKQIQVGGTFESKWGNYKYSETFKNATTGAVVALDVNTGEVLALANYPSYDPNLFATGITSEDWKNLQDQNPRDPLSPIPLYNVATIAGIQPGSTFKMVTGLAALDQGLDPNFKMYDDGYIKLGGRSFGCWLWNDKKMKHGWVDFFRALEVSCNYYFYNVSTGWDHYLNRPLPISMNVDKLLEYAKKVGLGEPTGIEIFEANAGVPSPEKKSLMVKSQLRRNVTSLAKEYFEEDVYNNKEELEKQIEQLVSWADENPSRGEVINRISKLGVKKDKIEALADMAKFSYYNQVKWSKGDTFNLSIGQGEHTYTPLQMARYIATIANGGYKNNVTVVQKVGNENQRVEDENAKERIQLNNYKTLDYIKTGMQKVTEGEEGTGRTVFKNFPIKVMAKTGTAQREGKIQPADEAEYLRKYLQWIAPGLSLAAVEDKAQQIKKSNNDKYKDEGLAMRKAIKELTNNRISDAQLDSFKDDYDNFAWFVSYAPYDNPQIAVVSLIFQGGHGGYAAPVAREIFAEYFGLNKDYEKIETGNTFTR